MFMSIRRGARVAAVVGLSAAVVVGLAGPASAAEGQNEATGIVAAGLIDAGPFAYANFPLGPFSDTLVDVTVAGLLSSGTVNADAGETSASASVEDLSVTLAPLTTLTASAVSSECSYDPETGTLSGSSSIVDGTVDLPLLLPNIDLEASPAPNTTVSVPGVAEITLNRQVIGTDGSLTVDAIYIDILNGTQTITIATSHCHPEVLVIPVIAPQFALGAGVLGLLALGFVLYRRRQTATAAV